jgi:hypothetical protein
MVDRKMTYWSALQVGVVRSRPFRSRSSKSRVGKEVTCIPWEPRNVPSVEHQVQFEELRWVKGEQIKRGKAPICWEVERNQDLLHAMNHLLTPRHPLHEPIEVLFVRNELEKYDGSPLNTYPVRKGWANLTDQTPHLQSIAQT